MTTPNRKTKTHSTTTAAAYEAARRNRESAEQGHAEAVAALTGAEEHFAHLVQRSKTGDTSVTGIERATAKADIEVRADLVTAAANAVETARLAEAPVLAEHWAEVLADRVTEAGTQDEEDAVEAVAAALGQLTERMTNRHHLMREAITQARAAGIPVGRSTGLPFGWEQGYMVRQPTAVYVNGERVPIVSPSDAVLDVLNRAVATLGYRLVSSYNAVTIKTD